MRLFASERLGRIAARAALFASVLTALNFAPIMAAPAQAAAVSPNSANCATDGYCYAAFSTVVSSGTWSIPANTYSIDILAVGGGGGGTRGRCAYSWGTGGGGGGVAEALSQSVTPGATATITVGSGGSGSGNCTTVQATAGTASSVTVGASVSVTGNGGNFSPYGGASTATSITSANGPASGSTVINGTTVAGKAGGTVVFDTSGNCTINNCNSGAGGGAGAAASGMNAGTGKVSSITGARYGGGGAGRDSNNYGTADTNAGYSATSCNAAVNSGAGGSDCGGSAGAGGSGYIYIRYLPGPTATAPSAQTVGLGQTATFSTTATRASNLTSATFAFQWQSSPDGTTWTDVSGATSASYTTPTQNSLSASGTQYRAKVTQTSGSLTSFNYSAAATMTVTKASQSINFGGLANKTYGDAPFTLNATASSSLAVTYTATPSTVCTVSGSTVTIVGVSTGTCSVTAAQAGDATYNAATSVTQSFTVSAKALTITANGDTKIFGATKTYGAGSTAFTTSGLVGSDSIGTVTITASGGALSNANVGTYTLTPSAATGGSFVASNYSITYVAGSLVVSAATPTFTWSNASTTYAPGGTYSLTAPTVTLGGNGTWTYTSSDTTVATVSGSSLNILKAGTSVITGTFTPSSSNFVSGGTATMTLTVGQATNTITWSQVLGNAVYGSSAITLSASATSGSVTYSTNDSNICSISGSTLSLVSVGSCTVTANQSGNTNYSAATAVSKTFSITQAANTISFGAAPTGLTYGETGQTRIVTATATNGTIQFSTTSTNCSVNASTGVVTILHAGTCVISASATSVSGNYGTPAAQTQTLTIATASVTAGTWSNDSATYAPGATYTVTPPTASSTAVSGAIAGSWVYSSGNTAVATVASGATLNLVGAGTAVITGTFTPTDTSLAATTATFTLTVARGGNTISWSQTLGSVVWGSGSISLSATATATGAVTYSTNNTSICAVSGSTLTLVGVGSCTVTANHAGDANYAAATAVAKTFSITQAANSISFGAAPTGLTYGETGQTRTVTATATNGTIQFSTSSTTCSVNASTGVVTILGAGSCDIVASATSVSGNFVTPTPQTQTLTIAQAANSITWSQTLGNLTYGASSISLTATATNGSVAYSTNDSNVCSISGSTLSITGAGTCVVTASQSGSSNYLAATAVSKTFSIAQASNSITFGAAPTGLTYGETGQTRTVTATATSGTIQFSTTSNTCSVNSSTGVVTLLAAGTCVITASATSVSGNFVAPASQTQTLTIATASVTAGNWSNASTTYAPSATYTVTPPPATSAAASGSLAGTWTFVSSDSTVAQLVSGAVFNLLKPGTVVITGTFTPTDSNFASTTATFTLTVLQGTNTISFAALGSRTVTGGTLSVAASSSSGLAVSITSATPGICSISAGVVTFLAVGTCTLNANQSGNTYYATANQIAQSFSVTSVTVTFDSNNGSNSTSTQSLTSPSGAALTNNSFSRTGYTFAGWSLTANGQVAYTDHQNAAFAFDTTVYAVWTANNYGVTYYANSADGGSVPTDTAVYTIGQSISVRSNTGQLVRTGYTFGGWNTAANGSGFTYNSGNTVTMGASSVLLYAIWTPNTYVITYNSNGASGNAQRGGNAVTTDNYTTAGTDVTLPSVGTLARTGYTFDGWSTTPTGGTSITGAYTTTSNITLYAKWNINVIAVNYSKGAASASSFTAFPSNTSGNYGTRITLSGTVDSPVTIGGFAHVFVGWSDGTSIYRAGDTYLLGVNAVTFTAQWVQIFGVRYTFAGGTPAGSDAVTDSECLLAGSLCTDQQQITANAAPTRAGYTFAGWVDQSGNPIAAGATFTVSTGTYLLYATWTANDYLVSYAANGGSGATAANQNFHYGDRFTVGSALTRTGYDFAGWSDGSQTYGAGAQYVVGLSPITLTAVWTPQTYLVGFDWNGGVGTALNARSYTVGNVGFALPSPTNQVRDGFTFAGWSLTSNGTLLSSPFVPTATGTLYAIWATGSYVTTFDAVGGTLGSTTLSTANGASGLLPTPTRNNFVFVGWYTASTGGSLVGLAGASFTPSASATLYARWVQSSLYGIAPGNLNRIGTINASPLVGSNFTGTSGQSGVSVSVPAGSLPSGTVVNLDLIADTSYAQSLISATNTYVLSLAVSWLASDGTVPDTAAGKPVTLTLTNPGIHAGALVYSIQNGVATLLGTAVADGTVTVTLTSDPGIYLVQTVASAPRNLAGVATQTSIDFTWSAPSTDGGSSITGYTLTLSNGSSCSVTTLACTISNLTAGTSYSAVITASNGVGTSTSASATVSTNAIPAPVQAPAPAPVILVPGAPVGLSASANGTTITLTWAAPANNGGAPITDYSVSSNAGLGCSTSGTSCVINGAVEGFTYVFFVTATNSAGTGPGSASASVTIAAPVVVPSQPEIVVVASTIAVVKVLPNTGTPVLAGVRVIQPILFNPDSAKLDAGDLRAIASVLDAVRGEKGTLLITGFVKYTGRSAAADHKLAAARAQAVAKALAKFGVTVKIGYLGYGPQNKVNPKPTDRKVEVRWVAAS
jgi:uncharacterized repeat protein (TIGR02543 family)